MNDVVEAPADTRKPVVRPRDAASLILLRGEGQDLEVLAGRRPLHVKFMPGVHVFPGGAIDPPDRITWSVEAVAMRWGPVSRALRVRRCVRPGKKSGCWLAGRLGRTPRRRPPGRSNEPIAN